MELFILAGAIAVFGLALGGINTLVEGSDAAVRVSNKPSYNYTKKKYFLTKSEKDFYDNLMSRIGNECVIFAQVHLSSILDHQVKGQSWKAALSHIQRKSVDFLICDKRYLSPLLVIELDDTSHSRPDRMERDEIVNNLLRASGTPCLRVSYQEASNIDQVASEIRKYL